MIMLFLSFTNSTLFCFYRYGVKTDEQNSDVNENNESHYSTVCHHPMVYITHQATRGCSHTLAQYYRSQSYPVLRIDHLYILPSIHHEQTRRVSVTGVSVIKTISVCTEIYWEQNTNTKSSLVESEATPGDWWILTKTTKKHQWYLMINVVDLSILKSNGSTRFWFEPEIPKVGVKNKRNCSIVLHWKIV